MSPAIIADSDDEGDDQDLSTVPITRRGDILQLAGRQTGYSDSMVSLPTSSTDPAHFQSVYKEQIAAAQQQQAQGARGAFVTPQDATQQTWEATDPVSLPSQYVNMHTVTSRANGLSENVQAGNGVDGAQQVEDPWEVPSSPEERTADSKSRRAAKKDAKSSESGQPLAADASNGNGARAYDGDGVDAQRAKKRRRVDQTQDGNADFAQRQAMDQELQNGTAEGLGDSSPPPTMPMRNDPSLVITTQPLSASQKMQYQSVEAAPGNCDEAYNSSQKSPTKEVDTPERKKTAKRKSPQQPAKKRQSRKKRTELSEEIIVLEDPVDDAHGVNEIDDAGIPDAQKRGLPDSDDEAYADEIVALGTQVEAEETVTTPAKPKKRGRPKKTNKDGATEGADTEKATAAPQPTETTKKKRGRPRKRKAEVNSAQQSPGSQKPDGQETKDEQQNSPTPELPPEEKQDVQPGMQPEPTDALAEEDSKEQRTDTPDDSKSVSAPAAVAKAGSNAVSRKQGGGSKASPSSDGKPPVYRVGLSRRSRIAPLLKIVRK